MELRFRIAGIPVRIEPGFWLMSALLGWGAGGIRTVLIWIACVFVGVLCHELGHAMAARAFGGRSEIVLYTMGGLTSTTASAPLGRARSVVVSLAGPVAGFLLGGVVLAVSTMLIPGEGSAIERLLAPRAADARILDIAVGYLLWINLGWGLVNLIPVLPFDGGHVAQQALGGGDTGWYRAAWVSIVIGPAVAITAFVTGWTWAGLLFAFSAVQTVRELMARRNQHADQKNGLHERMAAVHEALEAGDLQHAATGAKAILDAARAPELKRGAAHVLAIAHLRLGEPQRGLQVLESLPPGEADTITMGLCLLASGRPEEAARYFEVASERGEEGAQELLATALEQSGDTAAANEARSRHRD